MDRIKLFIINTTLLVMVFSYPVTAQNRVIDSLTRSFSRASDTVKVKILVNLGNQYSYQNNNEKALSNYLDALKLAETIQNKQARYSSSHAIGSFYEKLGKHEQALEFALKALEIAKQQCNKQNIYDGLDLIALIYFNEQNFDKSLDYTRPMLKMAEVARDKKKIMVLKMAFGDVYRAQDKPEKSLEIYLQALAMAKEIGDKATECECLHNIGLIYEKPEQFDKKLNYFLKAYNEAVKDNVPIGFFAEQVAEVYMALNHSDEALMYAKKSLEISNLSDKNTASEDYNLLKEIYASKKNYKEAYRYFSKYTVLNDSLNSIGVQNKMNLLQTSYNNERQIIAMESLQEQADLQSKLKNVLIGASILLSIVVFLIANRYRQEKRSEAVLSSKNIELNQTINELKSTQTQLIHAEKMASLGELTAGIAHEIQNPLNFVNNFSEVSVELLEELKNEAKAGNQDDVMAIADDLTQNLQKISHHGKRADFIVKGMLEHSRTSTGERRLTNINILADEFLKLSYHGLRAKDKTFNAEMITHFDHDLPKANVAAQDIGRVLLNLFNNAFYAVNQKQKTEAKHSFGAGDDYKPEVSVSTSIDKNKLVISVKDNGNGIPEAIKDKIMQPFFTTKPTGEGTGLGLSLSYDIVVKGHNGNITVDTKEGEFTEFTVILPL